MDRAPSGESQALLARLVAALDRRGIASPEEIASRRAATDRGGPWIGAAVVARAWIDPDYRRRLLSDGSAAVEEFGISMAGQPPLGVVEDTPAVRHLVVCTLCSCYPRAVLGYPPGWYKSSAYRARAVRDPRGVLAEFGTTLPPDVALRVVDSTADYRWMVLPLRPEGTEGWSADRLATLVTAEAIVGVRPPRTP